MKKEIVISIFLAVVGLVFIILLLISKSSQPTVSIPASTHLPTQNNVSQETTKTVFTVSEVSTHSTENDCWVIIQNSIYNVSSYNQNHPGGSLASYCGKDATQGYANKSGRGSHSTRADTLLTTMLVGTMTQ